MDELPSQEQKSVAGQTGDVIKEPQNSPHGSFMSRPTASKIAKILGIASIPSVVAAEIVVRLITGSPSFVANIFTRYRLEIVDTAVPKKPDVIDLKRKIYVASLHIPYRPAAFCIDTVTDWVSNNNYKVDLLNMDELAVNFTSNEIKYAVICRDVTDLNGSSMSISVYASDEEEEEVQRTVSGLVRVLSKLSKEIISEKLHPNKDWAYSAYYADYFRAELSVSDTELQYMVKYRSLPPQIEKHLSEMNAKTDRCRRFSTADNADFDDICVGVMPGLVFLIQIPRYYSEKEDKSKVFDVKVFCMAQSLPEKMQWSISEVRRFVSQIPGVKIVD